MTSLNIKKNYEHALHKIISSIYTEKIFANTIASNASIYAHLEIILRNQAEILSKQKGEDE